MLFYPNKCVFCKKFSLDRVCSACKEKVYFVYDPFCIKCQLDALEGKTHIRCYTRLSPDMLITPLKYGGLCRDVLLKSKYNKKEFSLIKSLVDYIFMYEEQFNLNSFDDYTVTFVPSDPVRFKERGFNLSSVIASHLSKKLNLKTKDLLKKKHTTDPLYNLKKRERKEKVRGLYTLRKKQEVPEKLILVDDILTTGSTLMEVSKVLKRGGAKQVICFALAFRPLKKG